MKTKEDLQELKNNWLSDPIYDVYGIEGFEEYEDELKKFQEEAEKKWAEENIKIEKSIDKKARNLGVEGLYRIILNQKTQIDRLQRAIESLNNFEAYKIMMGYDEE
jgi:predicted RNase H-like nuclease (RuvC/YqgF family)